MVPLKQLLRYVPPDQHGSFAVECVFDEREVKIDTVLAKGRGRWEDAEDNLAAPVSKSEK